MVRIIILNGYGVGYMVRRENAGQLVRSLRRQGYEVKIEKMS